MINILVINKTKYDFLYEKLFNDILKYICKIHNLKLPTSVNLVIVGNQKMKSLNYQYRQKNNATDILSFPNDFKNLAKICKQNWLGDIYISYQKVLSQARQFNHSIKREWCYLFAHGVLHLLGYDHQTSNEEKKMNQLSYKIMSKINVGRY